MMGVGARVLSGVLAVIVLVWFMAALVSDYALESGVLLVMFLVLMRGCVEGRIL